MKLRIPRIKLRRRRGIVGESKAWAAMSMAWMAITLSATNYLDAGPTRVLPPALQAATTTIGLWRPVPYAGFFAAILGSLLYVVAGVLSRFGSTGLSTDLPTTQSAAINALLTAAPGFATVCLALLGSAWLAESLAARTERDEMQRRQDRQLIEDLVPTHGDTGLLKWTYGRREMGDEVTRARRYSQPLSFALIGSSEAPDESQGLDLEEVAMEHQALADFVKTIMRPTDVVALYANGGALGVVMPHTPLKGALVALEKVHMEATKAGLGNIVAGLAEFPQDGADVDELCSEAEHALAFARESGLGAVSRGLLL